MKQTNTSLTISLAYSDPCLWLCHHVTPIFILSSPHSTSPLPLLVVYPTKKRDFHRQGALHLPSFLPFCTFYKKTVASNLLGVYPSRKGNPTTFPIRQLPVFRVSCPPTTSALINLVIRTCQSTDFLALRPLLFLLNWTLILLEKWTLLLTRQPPVFRVSCPCPLAWTSCPRTRCPCATRTAWAWAASATPAAASTSASPVTRASCSTTTTTWRARRCCRVTTGRTAARVTVSVAAETTPSAWTAWPTPPAWEEPDAVATAPTTGWTRGRRSYWPPRFSCSSYWLS